MSLWSRQELQHAPRGVLWIGSGCCVCVVCVLYVLRVLYVLYVLRVLYVLSVLRMLCVLCVFYTMFMLRGLCVNVSCVGGVTHVDACWL